MNTDGVHCRKLAGTGPLVLKVVPVTVAAVLGTSVCVWCVYVCVCEPGAYEDRGSIFPCSADHKQDRKPYRLMPSLPNVMTLHTKLLLLLMMYSSH